MRRIIVTQFLSLDGVMEHPVWSAPYWNDEVSGFKVEEDEMTDALLLGRVTYQEFAAAWPNSEDEGAPRINSMPKYVVSNTLTSLEWNNSHLISGDVIAGIERLRQQDGKDLLVYGSATLVQTLAKHDLIDMYRLLIYPVVLGQGKRLFQPGTKATLHLTEARALSSGVAALVYERQRV
ncbi:dihydrofolate reductase family protein [Kamptonema cortianum]|nr:dihydrofolate reductase family protein [Kamptonema cortianum]